jgi:hypothetical protein
LHGHAELVGELGLGGRNFFRLSEAVEHDGGPAAASARAMPRPIPLVEPVISDTRPESGRAAASSLNVSGLFMTWLRG